MTISRFFKVALTSALFVSASLTADAVIAKRDVRTVSQPDGTTLRIRVVGDEFMHFTTTDDGTLLHRDEAGLYTFGRVDESGIVVSTGVSATAPTTGVRTTNIAEIDMDALALKRNVAERRSQAYRWVSDVNDSNGMQRAPQTGMGMVSSTYPHFGSPKGLIILVEYADFPFTLSTERAKQYFNDMINKPGFNEYNGTGSALDYFTEQSGGKFVPSFDVLGPVKLPNNRSYYGGNDAYGDDKNPEMMAVHAVQILDPTVDFSVYDTDGDGYIDNVFIFYAGQGEASYGSADTVWPHSWDVRYGNGANVIVDGVRLGHYACSNEWERDRPDGVGTFIHEFSHVMGLPDLYHTSSSSANYTPGAYSVLDYGPYNNNGCTPPNYGAYEKNAMGWYEPIELTQPMSVTLNPIKSGEFGLIPTSKTAEFFLLENRQLTGWDAYIPYHGMLIWHIDYTNRTVFNQNTVNNTKSHQYVDIVEANNNPNSSNNTAMRGYPFPGTTGKTAFTSTTTPALVEWSGSEVNYPITDIEEVGQIIKFNVLGGASLLDTPVPNQPAVSVNDYYFIASWNAVPNATDYYLNVYTQGTAEETMTNGFDGSRLPDGWTFNSLAGYYNTSGNYGASSPSFKFSTANNTLTSPETEGDINKIEFWCKGQSNDNATYLKIEGNTAGKWAEIERYVPTPNKAATVTIDNIPASTRQIRFVMVKSQGNIAVDDIVLTMGSPAQMLPDYNHISTGGETSYKVDKLIPGVGDYFYTVSATDGENESRVSQPIYVRLEAMAGVGDIAVDSNDQNAPTLYYNLQGMRIDRPQAGTVVIERRGNTSRKVLVK